jgi:undecaprenyl diphosphate synthase
MNTHLPKHIAIIPDGNRRWAKAHNLPVFEGHRRGAETTIKIARKVREMGVSTLTFWAFSTENWSRDKDEVKGIFGLQHMVKKYIEEANRDNVRITHLGRKDRLPNDLLKTLQEAEQKTKDNTDHYLNIALDYGGRDEVLRAIQKMQMINQTMELTEASFGSFLDTGHLPHPDPDIIIRTSGEQRTSGLMIWQAAYAEYFFLEKYYPDLTPEDIEKVVEEFVQRQRRFGK